MIRRKEKSHSGTFRNHLKRYHYQPDSAVVPGYEKIFVTSSRMGEANVRETLQETKATSHKRPESNENERKRVRLLTDRQSLAFWGRQT